MGMRRRAHGILLISADALKLIESVVAKLRSRKEKAGLQNAQGVCKWYSIKVLHLHLRNEIFIMRESDLVKIAIFTLYQEEEEVLELVCGVRHDKQAFLLGHLQSPWYGAQDIRVALLLVDQAILAANQDTTWTIDSTRNGNQLVRTVIHLVCKSPRHVVEAQVHLVQRQHLRRRLCLGIAVHFLVTQLNGREKGVLKTYIHANHGIHQCVALEGF
mmetsp:Transcript_42528/g.97466  ORF Transcript_42528/g.97466 Transcript_42528/m.97466 type:complete len:216 (-) Transcript_42528:509-1156(-)